MPRPSIGSRIRKSRKKAGKSAPPLKTSLKRGSKQSPRAGQKYSRKAAPKKAAPKKAAPKKPQREVGKPKYSQAGDYGDELTAAYLADQDIATAGVGTPLSPAAQAYLEANFKGIPIPEGGEPLPISPTQTYSESDKPFTPAAAPPVGRLVAGAIPPGEAIQAPGGSLFANIQGTGVTPQAGAVTAVPVAAAPQPPAEVAMIPATDIGETDPVGDAMSNDPALEPAAFQDQTEKLKGILRRAVMRQFASLLAGGKAGRTPSAPAKAPAPAQDPNLEGGSFRFP
tara:strand:+ start:203 stop:1051 length:849 start_codon:yes stop_codon:yes gene_type:complete